MSDAHYNVRGSVSSIESDGLACSLGAKILVEAKGESEGDRPAQPAESEAGRVQSELTNGV